MAVINLIDFHNQDVRESGGPGYSFGFHRTFSPVINGVTVAADDILVLYKFPRDAAPDIAMTHLQTSDMVVNATYCEYDSTSKSLVKNFDGTVKFLHPAYFGQQSFLTPTPRFLSLHQNDVKRRVVSIADGIKDTNEDVLSADAAVLVFQVITPPTGDITISFVGQRRSS